MKKFLKVVLIVILAFAISCLAVSCKNDDNNGSDSDNPSIGNGGGSSEQEGNDKDDNSGETGGGTGDNSGNEEGITPGEQVHQHNFFVEWAFDETGHWHNCSGCAVRGDFSAHEMTGNKCNVCDYEHITDKNFELEILRDGTLSIVKYIGSDTVVDIPSTVNGKTVSKIENNSFENLPDITEIKVPDSVKIMGNNAFNNCPGIINLTIPVNLISDFEYIAGIPKQQLKSVNLIGEGYLPNAAFEGCAELQNVTLGKDIVAIDRYAFEDCIGINEITIPKNIRRIRDNAFRGCTNLTSVNYDGDLKSWCEIDFGFEYSNPFSCAEEKHLYINGEEIIGKIQIPAGTERIGDNAFYGLLGITGIVIPDSVESIGAYSFCDCAYLETVSIGNEATDIKEAAFRDCTALQTVEIGKNVTTISRYAFSGCVDLTEITIPAGVERLEDELFSGCESLSDIYFPDTKIKWQEINKDYSWHGGAEFTLHYIDERTDRYIGKFVDEQGVVYYHDSESAENSYYVNGYVGNGGIVNIKEEINGIPVTKVLLLSKYPSHEDTLITEISMPESITVVGSSAFCCNMSLNRITIPGSIEKIGEGAFHELSSNLQANYTGDLKSWIEIDKEFGNEILNSQLYIDDIKIEFDESFTIPEGTTKIGDFAFKNTGLKEITIPDSVEIIGDYAFADCKFLQTVTIGEGVNIIGNYAFNGCAYSDEGLMEITIPDSVEIIGDYAFGGCENLQTAIIGDNVKRIGDGVFSGCHGLQTLTIGKGVTEIGSSAFSSCFALTRVEYTGDLKEWCELDFGKSVNSPLFFAKEHNLFINGEEIIGAVNIPEGTAKIGVSAFLGLSGITEIIIPDSVELIGEDAFYNCTGLQIVTIGKNVTRIEGGAFFGCEGITQINYNGDLKSWCEIVFEGNNPLHDAKEKHLYLNGEELTGVVEIPDGTTAIGDDAFTGITGITEITIPKSVTSIGIGAFWKCADSLRVNYKGDVKSWIEIDNGSDNKFLIERLYIDDKKVEFADLIQIPEGTKKIGNRAFRDFSNIEKINIPDSVESIGEEAFSGCFGLTEVTIPDKVTSIGGWGFDNCFGLKKISIPDSVKNIGYMAFSGCTGLQTIKIGNGVKDIGDNAFSSCIGLTEVTIPGGVEIIGDYAFADCEFLQTVTIGSGVKEIGEHVFSNCYRLKKINYSGTMKGWENIDKGNFDNWNYSIYCSDGLISTYGIKIPYETQDNGISVNMAKMSATEMPEAICGKRQVA